ncbi:MAG: hypothetical protein Q9186_001584, partial [Xanthomendoza sp. 1 TL-2023]
LASAHSPQRRHAHSSRTSPAPSAFRQFENADMDPRTPWRDTNHPTIPDGQDHDRMETDEEEHASSSEDNISDHQQQPDPATATNDEVMDTTPDGPREIFSDSLLLGPDSQASHSSSEDGMTPPSAPLGNQPEPYTDASIPHTPVGNGHVYHAPTSPFLPPATTNSFFPDLTSSPPLATSDETGDTSTDIPQDIAQAGAANTVPPEHASILPVLTEGGMPRPQEEGNNQENAEQQERGNVEDGQGNDFSDDGEHTRWVAYVEDTTGPDEDELRMIEQEGHETSELDDDHWESIIFEPLEDAEYVPGASGQIKWTLSPVHGTPDKPTSQEFIRSPSVLIGELYWNIKFFPRGNDSEYLSVYVECSPSPDGPVEYSQVLVAPGSEDDSDTESSSNEANQTPPSEEAPRDEDVHRSHTVSPNVDIRSDTDQQVTEITQTQTEDEVGEPIPWEASAQIGCRVYNPHEPSVYGFQKGCHRFTKDNPDWGWTRFHGHWKTIHRRQRLKRQALLRNDTLTFTAYIRIVKDDTKSLWWHGQKDKEGSDWDSYERFGVRSLATALSRDSAIVATMSCWLHLNPVVEIIKNMRVPNPMVNPKERRRPLFAALQQVLDYMFQTPRMKRRDKKQNAMANLASWLDWYITDTHMSRTDLSVPVAIWESVRRVLNREASATGDLTAASDLFQDILLLKQPDPWKDESPISSSENDSGSGASEQLKSDEPRSVQETIDLASSSSNPFRVWNGYAGRSLEHHDHPAVLQVELHRHGYDKIARKWKKLTHHIELNETTTYTASRTGVKYDYTLFGFIVEAGALVSQDCYSVIRPSGPGTRWIKYSGNTSQRGASCLTTTQAITAHEGTGRDANGDAAVAHIVLYVRTDRLSNILSTAQPAPQPSSTVTEPCTLAQQIDAVDDMPLRIYSSILFNSHIGRGLPDLWSSVDDNGLILDLRLPKAASIPHAIEHSGQGFLRLMKEEEATGVQQTCVMWYLKSDLNTVQGLPHIVPVAPGDTMDKLATDHGVCQIWFHVEKSERPRDDTTLRGDQSTMTQPAMTGDEPDDAVMTQDPSIEISIDTEEPAVENSTQIDELPIEESIQTEEPQVNIRVENGAESASPVGEPQPSTRNDVPDVPNVPVPTPQEGNEDDTDLEDAEMGEGQDATHSRDFEAPASAHDLKGLIYVLVKMFNLTTQELRGIGSKLVHQNDDVHTEVGRILGSGEDALEIYLEKGRRVLEDDQIRPSRSFRDYELQHGSILIAHRRPSTEEATLLVTQGKHTNPITYFQHLRYNEPLRSTYEVSSDYGTEYRSIPISNGLIHGRGTKIYSNGDAYVGHWVSSEKGGHGTMAYSSGDTYEGNWEHDEPNGQGKMVYGTTKNVYVGGWKKGRRHGKGVMTYEVADEELAMCKICYENEMDALFYDCGHVVACEECARQVDVCPVCRKNVRAVCRIWKT